MKSRRDRILDVAVSLAEEGGFDNVRQRDVAEQAGVALGTLYKAFRTKEDLLSAALERETKLLERKLAQNPVKGKTPVDRVVAFFQLVTRGMLKKPRYTSAVLRAMASGEPEVAGNVVSYQGLMNRLILGSLRGTNLSAKDLEASPPSAKEATLTLLLQQLWFSVLVAWSAGLLTQAQVISQMRTAAQVLTRGLEGLDERSLKSSVRLSMPRVVKPAAKRAPPKKKRAKKTIGS